MVACRTAAPGSSRCGRRIWGPRRLGRLAEVAQLYQLVDEAGSPLAV